MNGTITLRNLAVAGIMCLLAAACSDTEDGSHLPDGQYPMTFTAAVDGLTATRAAGKDAWAKDAPIAVSVDGGVSSKTYKITDASTGAMEPAMTGDGYYWQNKDDKTILAWYPAVDIANVDISDQSSGFSAFDYLKTESTTAGFGSDVALSFKHQMAKVKYTLVKGEGISDSDIEAATVTIFGYTEASFSKGTVSGSTNGWIKPAVENTSGEALVVPQQMQGKQFIKVTIGDKAYYYTPKGVDNGNLRAGYIENYTITVKQSGLSVVWQEGEQIDDTAEEATFKIHLKDFTVPEHIFGYSVTDADGVPMTATSGIYTLAGNELNISLSAADNYRLKTFLTKVTAGFCKQRGSYAAATRTYTYTFRDIRSDLFLDDIQAEAEEATSSLPQLKAGDYYYGDGTWSSTLTKSCIIGIVFKVGAGQDDQGSDYNGLTDNTIHGYAVALNDAHIATGAWGIRLVDVSDIENNDGSAGTKYDGYKNTTAIRKLSAYRSTDVSQPIANGQYWAFKVASEYGITAPDNTSGWYLPSIQQLADIYSLSELATRLTAAGGADFRQARYWSSTEKSSYDAWYYQFDGKGAEGYAKSNDGGNYLQASYVRAILTF